MSEASNISYLNFLKKIGISSFLGELPNNYYKINQKNQIDHKFLSFSEIKNLNELEYFVRNLKNIDIKKFNNKLVFKEENKESNIMIIGDIPDEEDEKKGKPFQGEKGILLKNMLNAINLKKENLYITNFCLWRPLKNHEITNDEIIKFLPFIQKQIEIIKPKIILLFGSITSKAILNTNLEFNLVRGKFYYYESINLDKPIPCLATYHPNYLILKNKFKKLTWEDLKSFQKKVIDENI